jgi:RNA-directed DNA polymerase
VQCETDVSTVEDKIVQGALHELLEQLYEPAFQDCSYGFRPHRGAHDALRTLNQALYRGEVNWILEADIQSYFDSIDRKMLQEMLWERIADKSVKRLVGKCLHVGILDGEEYSESDEGTVQGSVLSPLLGNVYLHHVLDRWFEREVRPRLRGKAMVVRYADDFVIGFELEEDARRVMAVIDKRFGRYGLKLHPEKTRLFPFRRPDPGQSGGKGPGTFEFLGFVVYWRRTLKGFWAPTLRTRKASLRRAIVSIAAWCRSHRCLPVKQQHAALTRRLVGHYNYFGVNGNSRSLEVVHQQAKRSWRKWLRRRSVRTTLNWANYTALLRAHPLPFPRVCVQLWAAT